MSTAIAQQAAPRGPGIFAADETAVLAEFFSKVGKRKRSGVVTLPASIEDQPELAEKVAAIALEVIQNRLPQWSVTYTDGTVVWGREVRQAPSRSVLLVPRDLLTINWADSGPGFSWPEAYKATFIPGFDRYVVTASRDSEDMWGCCDHAIGWFDAHADWKEASRKILRAWWKWEKDNCSQERWQEVISGDAIGEAGAHELRRKIWGKHEWE